eukprot:TRINITY_DN79952_c0_g1_i1.p1 TRINITY_DN79952_c0_g1~~TRINITY_DN79952_c0_g1_i1.p1  ORF type:complete len:600 (-),score=173.21 TRINITY_DN79952_c0_g1_i1:83-1882(-)
MVDTSFDPLEMVKEDLEQPSIELALQTIKKFGLVAKAIGAAETRDKMVPYIYKYAGFDQENRDALDRVIPDEALAEIAKVLSEFLPLIGGTPHAQLLTALLENFALAQETCVREAAVESLRRVIPGIRGQDPKLVSILCIPICKKLSADDWFSSKCSAAGIIPGVHANISDPAERASLRAMFLQIVKDETPLVRKYAYDHLGELAVDAGVNVIRTELNEAIKSLLEETQESIRIITVDVAVKLTEACKNTPDDFKEIAYPVVEHIGSDQSWRVRKSFAKAIGEMASFLPKDLAGQTLVNFYVELLKDPEGEVRLSAVKSMANVAKNIDEKSFLAIAQVLDSIMADSVQNTKIALSEVILEVSSSVGKALASKTLLPFIIRLLESDVADMRSNVLEKLGVLASAIGVDEVIAQFLPKILPMSKDTKWRVRKLVLENITNFARSVGPDVFESAFRPILFEALADTVFGVREAATKQFPQLVQTFGFDWAALSLLPEALGYSPKNKNYLHRMVPLLIAYELASQPVELPLSYIANVLGQVVINFSRDSVVNVRSFSVKTLAALAKKADASFIDNGIKPALMTLTQDSDSEVKLSAARALKGL